MVIAAVALFAGRVNSNIDRTSIPLGKLTGKSEG